MHQPTVYGIYEYNGKINKINKMNKSSELCAFFWGFVTCHCLEIGRERMEKRMESHMNTRAFNMI